MSIITGFGPKGTGSKHNYDQACTVALTLGIWHYNQGLAGPECKRVHAFMFAVDRVEAL